MIVDRTLKADFHLRTSLMRKESLLDKRNRQKAINEKGSPNFL
jgi:hypothetical protein